MCSKKNRSLIIILLKLVEKVEELSILILFSTIITIWLFNLLIIRMYENLLQKSSNPSFLKTVCFWPSDGLNGESCIRVSAYDVREKFSGLATPLGNAKFYLSTLMESHPSRFRVQLLSSSNVVAGFLTLTIWRHERENATATSTESTPCRSLHHNNSFNVRF